VFAVLTLLPARFPKSSPAARCLEQSRRLDLYPPSPERPLSTMLGASYLPARLRSDHGHTESAKPGYLNRCITPILQSVSRKAFTHPIHTIVFVALLASTSYIGSLEDSLLDRTSVAGNGSSGINLAALVEGGRRLKLGEQTGWRWHTYNEDLDVAKFVGFAYIPSS